MVDVRMLNAAAQTCNSPFPSSSASPNNISSTPHHPSSSTTLPNPPEALETGFFLAFELSVFNVDKPSLSELTMAQRTSQFAGRWNIFVTNAPTFVASCFCFSLFPLFLFLSLHIFLLFSFITSPLSCSIWFLTDSRRSQDYFLVLRLLLDMYVKGEVEG